MDPDAPIRIGVSELRQSLAAVLRQAQHGRTFLVMSHDQVVAELRPAPAALRPMRQPGGLRGKVIIAPDCDALPDDVLAAMEG